MARLLTAAEAKLLDLPGRRSRELVSGKIGSRLSFRLVEIAPQKPGDKPRGPHLHSGFEECIYVLSGRGMMQSESGALSAGPGDVLLVPAGEKHMTVNIGNETLVLLCFFPVPDVGAGTTEFASF
ncbi:MAG TPA: cupin domain-containing protein [Xanthobacteraceae bacterium]|jgi:quercetin dioxygenase-like cupin family protein|nr:cupin domain-containing protein [Xanthobacteraceae bacterium]